MNVDEIERLALWSAVRRFCSFRQRQVLWWRFKLGLSIGDIENQKRMRAGDIYRHETRGIRNVRRGVYQRDILLEHAEWLNSVLLPHELRQVMRVAFGYGRERLRMKTKRKLETLIYALPDDSAESNAP